MEWEFIAPMVLLTTTVLTIGGVLVLRPIAKRLGDVLELFAKSQTVGDGEVQQLRELMETMNARLQLMEERQDFTERLLQSGSESRSLSSGEGPHA